MSDVGPEDEEAPERETGERETQPINDLHGNQSGAREIKQRQRAAEMVELAKAGMTLRAIGDRYDVTDKRVSQIINNELRRTTSTAALTYKELITAQRFDLIRTWWPLARGLDRVDDQGVRHKREPSAKAAAVVDRQLEAIAKLWGLEKLVIDVGRTQEERAEALYQAILAYHQGRADVEAEHAAESLLVGEPPTLLERNEP